MQDEDFRDTSKLERLAEVISSLPPFPPIIDSSGEWIRHEMTCGTSLCRPLLILPSASVYQWFNSSGTFFQEHAHEQDEFLLVIEGSMYLTLGDQPEMKLDVGRCQHVPAEAVHRARFLEDCWYIASTVPRNPDWPS